MFLHVVLMQLSGAADAAFHARVQAYCERVTAECEGVLGYSYGENQAARSDGLGHTVVGVFTDSAAHDRYQAAPAHQEMKTYMAAYIERLVVHDGDIPPLR